MRSRIEAEDARGVAVLVNGLDEAGRKAVAGELAGYVREAGLGSWRDDRVPAARVAGAGCLGGAAAAAAWICRREMRGGRGRLDTGRNILAAVAHRPDAWRADFGRRLADRLRVADLTARADAVPWQVSAALLREAGQAPPATGAFVGGWLTWGRFVEPRDDPHFAAMVPALFEADGVGEYLAGVLPAAWDDGGRARRPLVADLLTYADRAALLDGCVSRFLRGGEARALAWFVRLHDELEPKPAEAAARLRDYVRLLPGAPAAVAEAAFAAVRLADEAEPLPEERLREAAEALLFRQERRIVKAALSWLDRTAAARGREAATVALVAAAFGHEHSEIRERAVRIAVKRAKAADPLTAETVREAAATLPAPLRAEIEARYGTVEAAGEPVAPVLHPVAPRELDPPIDSPAELVEELSAHLTARSDGRPWAEVERLLAGIVVHGPAAAEEVRAVALRRRPYLDRKDLRDRLHGLDLLLSPFVLGKRARSLVRPTLEVVEEAAREDPVPARLMRMRCAEAAVRIGGPAPLATPTSATGHLDPEVFAARLRVLEEAGAEPGEHDLEQALLRLPAGQDAARALAGLASPAAERARAWLAEGGLPEPVLKYELVTLPQKHYTGWHQAEDVEVTRLVATASSAADLPWARLLGNLEPPERADLAPLWSGAWWPAVLPSHRELVAAHLLAQAAHWPETDYRQGGTVLALADATGPAGPATAAVLLFGLSSEAQADRAAALDAVLSFAAQGALPAEDLGRHLGVFTRSRGVVLGRVVPSLADAVRAGARLWPLFAAAVTELLPAPDTAPPAGLADLLAAASEEAELHGVRGEIPALAAWKPKSRASRAAKEAARLRATLASS